MISQKEKEFLINKLSDELKIEYFGDQFAKKMYAYNCPTETLMVAEEKVNYLKSVNIKQGEINFDNEK